MHACERGRDLLVATNNNWADEDVTALRQAFVATGAFGLPYELGRDSALRLTLPAGVYTAVAGRTGEALVEVYEEP